MFRILLLLSAFLFLKMDSANGTIIFNILDSNGPPICNNDNVVIETSGYSSATQLWTTPQGFNYTSTQIIINNGQPENSGWYLFQIFDGTGSLIEEDSILIVFPPAMGCPSDTVLQAPSGSCEVVYTYPTPMNPCTGSPMFLISGLPSGAIFPKGITTNVYVTEIETNYLIEPFNDNSAGWTMDPEWQIGPAVSSNCANPGVGNDPPFDHSPDFNNGVAGVVIGGCANIAIHPYYYLTSPVIDLSSEPNAVSLEFFRHLHSDYPNYMNNSVEVFDGSNWISLWNGPPAGISLNDPDWILQSFDLTPYKNAAFRVRFGFLVGASGVFNSGSWSLDDVRIYRPASPLTCQFDVTVINNDTIPPVLICNSPLYLDASTGECFIDSILVPLPLVSENCGLYTLTDDAPSQFTVGYWYVTYTATDEAGNSSTCYVDVIVADQQSPDIICAAPVNLFTTGCNPVANPGLTPPTVNFENCGIYSVTNDAPPVFSPGSTQVSWMVTDYSLNTSICLQTVNVTDTSNVISPPVCPLDTTLYSTGAFCGAYYYYPVPSQSINCIPVEMQLQSGLPSGSIFPIGTTNILYSFPSTLFEEDFSDNSAGWLLGPQWQIGAAVAGTCQPCPGNDPGNDHSPSGDNGLAGILIGGCTPAQVHGFYYLTSPVIDLSTVGGNVLLEFWKHLHSDYAPYMNNIVEVFNGASWVQLYTSPANICENDLDWTQLSYDVTAYKNNAFQIRFGYSIGAAGSYISGGWSVDDIKLSTATTASCAFSVTVLDVDSIPPQISCDSVELYAATLGLCSLDFDDLLAPSVYEPCGVFSLSNDAPINIPVGLSTVTWTATDPAGNSASCQVTVNVVDAEPPYLSCAATDTVYAPPGSCVVTGHIPGYPLASDNCSDSIFIYTEDTAATFFTGSNYITWYAIDEFGNSANCQQEVYVLGDTTGVGFVDNCSADISIQSSPWLGCNQLVYFSPPQYVVNCIPQPMMQINGLPSGSLYPGGTTTNLFVYDDNSGTLIYNEDFSDTLGGWTTEGFWQIGTAIQSLCGDPCPGDDPAFDHSSGVDNGLAGVSIGGCINQVQSVAYLTSPAIDLTGLTGVQFLEIWRHLHSDYDPYIVNTIEVYNGVSWNQIFTSSGLGCMNDLDWTKFAYNVTPYANSQFKVRFGVEITDVGAYFSGSWSLDDISIKNIQLDSSNSCSFTVTIDTNYVWYEDYDLDGFGNSLVSVVSCIPPVSYVSTGGDCDDSLAVVNPSQFEICGNGIDDDCSGADSSCSNNSSLLVRCFIEGFYMGSGQMIPVLFNSGLSLSPFEVDSIVIQLVDPLSPTTIVESQKVILNINGYASALFSSDRIGNAYYIVVNHRNVIQTWSKLPVTMTSFVFYDFTSFVGSAVQRIGGGNHQGEMGPLKR